MLLTPEKHITKPFWKRDRFAYLLLIVFGAAMVFIAATISPSTSPSSELPHYSPVRLPVDYRTRFVQYATVQRPDGTIRNLYINSEGIDNLRGGRGLASNTVIVIEGYYALKDAEGDYLEDSTGHYVTGAPFEMIHVLEKRQDWAAGDFVDDNRIGQWNFGSFDTKTGGYYDENMSACFHCHNATSQTDFLYSSALLRQYMRTQQIQFFICDLPDRLAC